MKEHVTFELKSITVEDDFLPKTKAEAAGGYDWVHNFSMEVKPTGADAENYISVSFTYSLFADGAREDDDALLWLDTVNTFRVTGGRSEENKIHILEMLYQITLGTFEGVYAALAERSAYSDMLPPEFDIADKPEKIKSIVQNEWS